MEGYVTGPRARRILYVEDSATSRKLVTVYFERKGYVVDTAPDVIQALMKLIKTRYDAIVLDYHLPITSPREAERSLRKAKVPICFYTYDTLAASPSPDIPLVSKGDETEEGGLPALQKTLERLMSEPVADDYDKTRRLTEEELGEACRAAGVRRVLFEPSPERAAHG